MTTGRKRFGKKRVPECQCEYNFTCRPCLDAATVDYQIVPRGKVEPCHDVLCGCGWGRLAMPESKIPPECPLCGQEFPIPS